MSDRTVAFEKHSLVGRGSPNKQEKESGSGFWFRTTQGIRTWVNECHSRCSPELRNLFRNLLFHFKSILFQQSPKIQDWCFVGNLMFFCFFFLVFWNWLEMLWTYLGIWIPLKIWHMSIDICWEKGEINITFLFGLSSTPRGRSQQAIMLLIFALQQESKHLPHFLLEQSVESWLQLNILLKPTISVSGA